MKITFAVTSSRLPGWLSEITQDYVKKLSFWLSTECVVLQSPAHGREAGDRKRKVESETVLNFFKPDDFVILCDERGKVLGSKEFSKKIETWLGGGKKRLVFCVGGAYGVTDEVKRRADFTLALSALTTTHHMALALICEQVYRAMTLLKGVKYHND